MLPLELSDVKTVKTFSQQVLEKIGGDKIDYLLLNAAITNGAENPGPEGWRWCEATVVNHFCEPFKQSTCLMVANECCSTTLSDTTSEGETRRV